METSLHEDLVLEILLRLPVKSLMRFRCVSRSWYAIIASSSFVAAHLRHNDKIDSYRVLLRSFNPEDKKVKYKLCLDNETLNEIMVIDCPFLSQHNDFLRMVGCANGLVCLSDDIIVQKNTLVLWNPVIRRFVTVPKPELDIESATSQSIFGFGFDSLNNDYKVIWILYHKGSAAYPAKVSMAIFRLSTCSWKVNEADSVPLLDSRQAYVNGVIHWLAYTKLILGFNVGTEVLHEIMLPESLQSVQLKNLTVASWRSLLSIFENKYWPGRVSFWVMKDYGMPDSWVRQFVVESPAIVRGLRRNGNVILNIGGKLIMYNPNTNQFEDFTISGEGSLHGFHMKSYVESLALLDRMDAQLVMPNTEENH